jgi:hypothetical protein
MVAAPGREATLPSVDRCGLQEARMPDELFLVFAVAGVVAVYVLARAGSRRGRSAHQRRKAERRQGGDTLDLPRGHAAPPARRVDDDDASPLVILPYVYEQIQAPEPYSGAADAAAAAQAESGPAAPDSAPDLAPVDPPPASQPGTH